MKAIETETLPAPPSLISALQAGFDTITTHIALILFPIALDLLLWFGPHLGVKSLVDSYVGWLAALPDASGQNTAQLVQTIQDIRNQIGQPNIMTALRAYPVGIPSIMAGRLPIQTPIGLRPLSLDINSIFIVLALWVLLSFLGLILGTFYFSAVAQASAPQKTGLHLSLRDWFKASINVLLLTFFWIALLMAVSIPASCIISALTMGGSTLVYIGVLLYGAAMIWLLFPLVLSPHGIFVNRDNFLVSLRNSVRITRMTLPTTGLLVLSIIVISQGLNLLWLRPEETSWLSLVGVAGHAFVTTGLLAASFIYYRDADRWVKAILKYWSENPPSAKLKIT
jgi:hypothetical protein